MRIKWILINIAGFFIAALPSLASTSEITEGSMMSSPKMITLRTTVSKEDVEPQENTRVSPDIQDATGEAKGRGRKPTSLHEYISRDAKLVLQPETASNSQPSYDDSSGGVSADATNTLDLLNLIAGPEIILNIPEFNIPNDSRIGNEPGEGVTLGEEPSTQFEPVLTIPGMGPHAGQNFNKPADTVMFLNINANR